MLHLTFGILYDALNTVNIIQKVHISYISQKGHFSCTFKEKAYAGFCFKKYVFYGIISMTTEGNIFEKLNKIMLIEKSSFLLKRATA